MFNDTQIKEENFLEDISNLLNTGEVPNLFTPEEKIEICEKMRQLDRQRDKSVQTDGSPVALFNFFVTIVREQLHTVLTMSPIGENFRIRLRKFPALVNCCTIDWFQVSLHSFQFHNWFKIIGCLNENRVYEVELKLIDRYFH